MKPPSELPAEAPSVLPANGKREIIVSGNEIYLPDSQCFRPEDADFAAIVTEVLPEYAPSLSEEALRRPRGYPVWAVLLILVFLGSLIAGLYFLRPVRLVEDTSMEVPAPKITRYSGEFSQEFRRAMDYVGSKKYGDARKCLEPVIDKLLERRSADEKNDPIFYSYFCLFKNLPWDIEAGRRLTCLMTLNSDYRWKLFEIQYQLDRMGGEKPGHLSEYAKLNSVDSIYRVMGRIDDLRKLLSKEKELTRQLDLYKCYFALKVWRKLNRNKPDDERGQRDREEVWQIASRYPNDRKFRAVRIYLVRTLIKETKGYYIFNGTEYFLNKHLEKVLNEEIRQEISTRQEGKK